MAALNMGESFFLMGLISKRRTFMNQATQVSLVRSMFLNKNYRMIFSAKWPIESRISWQSAVQRLIKNLADEGCIIFGEGNSREICVPGLDERVMAHFRGQSDEGLMTEDWKSFLQREFWGRAKIKFDAEKRTVEYRWTYWSSFQIAFHLLLGTLFFGTGCRVEWAWLLFVPTLFAATDALMLNHSFSLWHAKCSLSASAQADR
jgi:hypothetical protein